MLFRYIGGKCLTEKLPALVQAESIFHYKSKLTCITTTITSEQQTTKLIKWIPVTGPTEGDWLSVLEAIRYSLVKNEPHIHIENNNLQVVESLLSTRRKNVDKYASYKYNVLALANQTEWTGIRWVPDESDAKETNSETDKAIQHMLGQ